MELKIYGAEDKGEKIIFQMSYDKEFERAIAKVYGVSRVTKEDIEDFIIYVLESIDGDELRKLGYEIDE
jgi:hypothetical protein